MILSVGLVLVGVVGQPVVERAVPWADSKRVVVAKAKKKRKKRRPPQKNKKKKRAADSSKQTQPKEEEKKTSDPFMNLGSPDWLPGSSPTTPPSKGEDSGDEGEGSEAGGSPEEGVQTSDTTAGGRSGQTLSIVDLSLGVGVSGRRLGFKDATTANLRPYRGAAPALLVRGGLYPMARRTSLHRVIRGLGVKVGVFWAPVMQSSVSGGGEDVKTKWSRWSVGPSLVFRWSRVALETDAHYSEHRFVFSTDDASLAATFPTSRYKAVGAGTLLTLSFDSLSLSLGASIDYNFDGGRVADDLDAKTMDVSGRFGILLPLNWLGLRWGAEVGYRRVLYFVGENGIAQASSAADNFVTSQLMLSRAW